MATDPVSGTRSRVSDDGSQPVEASLTSKYPKGATPVANSVTGTTTATTATLPAAAGKTTYIAGLAVSGRATAAIAATLQVQNALGGTLNFDLGAPAAPAVGMREIYFNPPVPANAVNTTIPVVLGALGAGGVSAVTAWGYQL